MKTCTLKDRPTAFLLRPCPHQGEDDRVGRLVRTVRKLQYRPIGEEEGRELAEALKAFDGEYESPEGREGKV